MIHRRTHPNLDQPDCFGCKASTISFGTVPGGAKDQRTGSSALRQKERDLHRYREKRRIGERPDGTTKAAMDKFDRRMHSLEKSEKVLRDDNPPEVANKLIDTAQNRR